MNSKLDYSENASIPDLDTADGRKQAVKDIMSLRRAMRLRDANDAIALTSSRITMRAMGCLATISFALTLIIGFSGGLAVGAMASAASDKEKEDVRTVESSTTTTGGAAAAE